MQFRRIKITPQRVELEWARERADGRETKSTTLGSTDAPTESFVATLQAFKPFVLKILEITEPEWSEGLIVQSVSLNEEDDGRRGIVITALRTLSCTQAPAVLNTPHLREDIDGTGAKGFMLRGMLDRIEEIEAEAERTPNGYLIAHDAVRKQPVRKVG